ncbi:MAG: hypothetical protein A2W90_18730 [Bacteroidetes bacterium GWF2_42_66]|nr:MAG: hypothetical protein A2W92_05535 [Bacteroidetes bacterium GWA2_42_15]OFX98837.1 MAG: hypothetical protein A2W89_10965 [Bacteroidetes bacterium GWE2_42_39]OFY43194.1 MAG: hypothetical protein A2W90_18730 [Bacteroidetes bacterium GWF2_42_66]
MDYLRCEYATNPLGIEASNLRLSWIIQSDVRGQKQTAYHILVASDLEKLNNNEGDIWDSQKVKSDQSVQVAFQGKKTKSQSRCYWKVRIWDKNNHLSEWSEPAFWEMGLLNPDDWKAKWIAFESASSPLFRKEFEVSKEIKDARVYISGLGYYELSMNGSRIGDHVLDPGQTDYEQRTFYVVYDVTNQLKQGHNAIGVMLGDGWYHQTAVNHGKYGWKDVIYGIPRLIFQLHLTFSDGKREIIISDETWKVFSGPVIANNIYAGEQYDARLEKTGWDTPGYDDSSWEKVMIVESPGGRLVSQQLPPIKRMQTIKPVALNNPKPGIYIYDMGQNFAGWVKLKLEADKGTTIQLRFAEWLGDDGMIDPESTGQYATGVVQTDRYTCKGDSQEIWEPRFTYHGFRYVEMTGFPGIPTKENLEGIVVHTSLEKSGTFECSDSLINKLYHTALWTMVSNMHSIPTDCPHRERCGWLGDAFLVSDMTIYNFDAALFWSKFIRDIETSLKEGIPTNIAPGRRQGGVDPDWGVTLIQLPWNMFLYYNDTSIVADHYDEMKFFMDHLEKMAEDYIIYKGIGSLFSPGRIMPLETPKEFTTTALFYFCSEAMAHMAQAIGKKEDADKYSTLSLKIKSAFNNKFYDQVGKTYGGQEKNVLALAFVLAPDNDEKVVAQNLNRDVVETHNGHIATGIFGSRYIHWVLARYGYGETLKNMLHENTFPGYGYLFSRGATTFWENWGELTFADRKSNGDGRSKSHPFQGGFTAWLYNGIGGINPDPENPGFKHIILRPQFMTGLTFAKANYKSIYGLIKSEWKVNEDQFDWNISIPANTTASVYIPVTEVEKIRERNDLAKKASGVEFLKTENGNAVFKIGSGNYTFSWDQ